MVHLLFFPEKLVQRGTCSPIRDPGLKESLGHLIYKHRNSFSKVRYFLFQFLLNVFMGNSPLPNPPASFANQFWGPENAAVSHTKAPSCPRYIPMGRDIYGEAIPPPSLLSVFYPQRSFLSPFPSPPSFLLPQPQLTPRTLGPGCFLLGHYSQHQWKRAGPKIEGAESRDGFSRYWL